VTAAVWIAVFTELDDDEHYAHVSAYQREPTDDDLYRALMDACIVGLYETAGKRLTIERRDDDGDGSPERYILAPDRGDPPRVVGIVRTMRVEVRP